MGPAPVFFSLSFFFRGEPLAMLLPMSVYLIPLFDLIAVALSPLLHFYFFRCCVAYSLSLSLYVYLVCLALLVWFPFLPYAYYMWLSVVYFAFVCLLFLGLFPLESLPGSDLLCRLLSRPLRSV